MEPSPFNDIRTVWFDGKAPNALTDYEIFLEHRFNNLVERSISKFPNLWGARGRDIGDGDVKFRSYHFLRPSAKRERVIGHYCLIKPLTEDTRDFLRQLCEPYGYIVEAKTAKSKIDGTVIGIVDFKEEKDAKRAVAAIDGMNVTEGVTLSALYAQKQKRPKVLNDLAERQSPIERWKQHFTPATLSNFEAGILADLCQQWACFSETHGSAPLAAFLNLSAQYQPAITIYEPITPAPPAVDTEIENVLAGLDM